MNVYYIQAEAKGLSETTVGWIFGIAALVEFLSPPLWGSLLPHVGCRFMFLAGVFFAAACTILFGCHLRPFSLSIPFVATL